MNREVNKNRETANEDEDLSSLVESLLKESAKTIEPDQSGEGNPLSENENTEFPEDLLEVLSSSALPQIQDISISPQSEDELSAQKDTLQRLTQYFEGQLQDEQFSAYDGRTTKPLEGRVTEAEHLDGEWSLDNTVMDLEWNKNRDTKGHFTVTINKESKLLLVKKERDKIHGVAISNNIYNRPTKRPPFLLYANEYCIELTTHNSLKAHTTYPVTEHSIKLYNDFISMNKNEDLSELYVADRSGITIYNSDSLSDLTYRELARINVDINSYEIVDAEFSPQSRQVALNIYSKKDREHFSVIRTLPKVGRPINLGFIGKYILGHSPKRSFITLSDKETYILRSLFKNNFKVRGFSWSKNGKSLAVILCHSSNRKYSVQLYKKSFKNLPGKSNYEMNGIANYESQERIDHICLNPDGTALAVASRDTVKVFGPGYDALEKSQLKKN